MIRKQRIPVVTVVGCGYVGVTTAAILSNCGYTVRAVEREAGRLDVLRQGRSFFYEAGVDELLQAGLATGQLTFGSDAAEAAAGSDLVFSCVGTPDKPDGSSDLRFVESVAADCAAVMRPGSRFIQKSTVPAGTGSRLQPAFQARDIDYVSNPEFLREGTAILDTLYFDRSVAGSDDPDAAEAVLNVYRRVTERRGHLARLAGLEGPAKPVRPAYMATGLASAELIKVTANAFLALKISFANSIARLADATGGDIVQVMDAVGADRRISRAFLNAGRGYGGGCFPKDVSGLIHSAADQGIELAVMQAAAGVNAAMPDYVVARATTVLGGSLKGRCIAVLGLAFKAGTSDVRRSPAVAIANQLAGAGAEVRAYDPWAMPEASELLVPAVTRAADAREAATGTDCLIIATDWPEFLDSLDTLLTASGAGTLVDAMNCVADPAAITARGIRYVGIGRG